MEQFTYILILLSCSVIFISICRRIHLPPIIGYLSVGILVGPGGLHWLPSIENMHFLAEFGIVFLMFTLGLEFSIPKLMATKRALLGVGSLQVITCTVAGATIAWLLGLTVAQSFVIGAALALSSTAVVIKQITEQKEQSTEHGQMSINILIFQDIAAVLFFILVQALSGTTDNSLPDTLLETLIKGMGAFVAMALIGLWILRPLFHEVAKARSTELFMLATLLVALSAAGITEYLGLSMALGAFLAGLMLGETEFRHQIEIDIRPFRDVLLGLFFVVIGSYLELYHLPSNWHYVCILLIAMVAGKTLLIMLIAALFGKVSFNTAFRTGLILAHGGEFGFVILTAAIEKNILDPSQKPALFTALVLSIVLAPFMIRYNEKLTRKFVSKKNKIKNKDFTSPQLTDHAAILKNHVILCGFGRVGQILARFLEHEHIPWLALDLDPMRISKSSIAGEHSFYGNATHPETLAAAGLARARMIVITFSDETSALEVLMHVRAMRLDVPVFVRTRDDNSLEEFQKAGATEVVPESLEGSIMLASHLLLTLGVPTAKILNKMRRIHTDRYEMLRGYYQGTDDLSTLEEAPNSRRSLHSLVIPDGAYAVGKSIEVLFEKGQIPPIKSLTRNKQRTVDPSTTMPLASEDVLVILATPEEAGIIEEKILSGN